MGTRVYRAHQRYRVNASATVVAPARGVVARGRILDLGLGGAAFELDTPLRVGERAELQLLDDAPAFLGGTVTWVGWCEASAARVGVRFDENCEPAVTSLLDELVERADVGT
jgi:hypothetical protein